ncbi:DUF3821 domain-containing protein [Methanoplanus endosymbiosus]|uniref:DUF3821 domain-containing protein n=1 Tax=Methanoplanus endosymbiosus TaxID=33865 RepID=A0A9E7PK10_9EURY|nr:DUF3821 domain-containing protein [Methanoplanus endosymbiosus]UUX91418.1 DUF3821 domain-containing protein [Methanoplanus endosymbiosus]
MKKSGLITITGLILFLLFIAPASAVLTNIGQGDTVFLGEEGLTLTPSVFYSSGGVTDNQLAYFGSGANPATSAPSYMITPDKSSFYVDPNTFGDKQSAWYSYPNGSKNGHVAFYVNSPAIGIKLYAVRPGDSFDLTNGKVVKGEGLDFRIDSNLNPIFTRSGVAAGDDGVDIKFQDGVGATLTALYDCTGSIVSIVNIHPTSSMFYLPSGTPACVWDTGNDAYKMGSYKVWAECNVNGMKDNLGSITGETVTSPIPSLAAAAAPTSTPTPEETTATETPVPATTAPTTAPTAVVTETETPAPVVTETPVVTPAVTATSKGPADLPQTPLSMLTVISGILAVFIAVNILKKE